MSPGSADSPVPSALLLRRTELLTQLLTTLASQRTLGDITGSVKRAVREGAAADGVAFVLRDGDECFYLDEDAMAPLWKGQRFPMATCVSGWAMTHRTPVVIPDVFADDRVPQAAYRATFVKSMVMVPIRGLRSTGAIGAYWGRNHTADAPTVTWLQTVADAVSPALDLSLAKEDYQPDPVPAPDQPAPLVRVCAWTRRVELDGVWMPFETYLRMRFGLKVTHTISDQAASAMMEQVNQIAEPPKG